MPQQQAEEASEVRREGGSIASLVLVVGVLLAIAAFFVVTIGLYQAY